MTCCVTQVLYCTRYPLRIMCTSCVTLEVTKSIPDTLEYLSFNICAIYFMFPMRTTEIYVFCTIRWPHTRYCYFFLSFRPFQAMLLNKKLLHMPIRDFTIEVLSTKDREDLIEKLENWEMPPPMPVNGTFLKAKYGIKGQCSIGLLPIYTWF